MFPFRENKNKERKTPPNKLGNFMNLFYIEFIFNYIKYNIGSKTYLKWVYKSCILVEALLS